MGEWKCHLEGEAPLGQHPTHGNCSDFCLHNLVAWHGRFIVASNTVYHRVL